MRMCQYGNCDHQVVMSSGNGISVNYFQQEKPAFCCSLHAALWLLQQSRHRDSDKLMVLIESELFPRKFAKVQS